MLGSLLIQSILPSFSLKTEVVNLPIVFSAQIKYDRDLFSHTLTRMDACTHTHTHTHTHIHMYIWNINKAYIYVYVCSIYIYIYTHIYTYMYMYVHIEIHAI